MEMPGRQDRDRELPTTDVKLNSLPSLPYIAATVRVHVGLDSAPEPKTTTNSHFPTLTLTLTHFYYENEKEPTALLSF